MATQNPKSTARIAGHPIHPMLIPFPIALFVAALVCDIAYWRTGNVGWTTAALWLIVGGLAMASLAAITGVTDVLGDGRIRALRDVWWHMGGNVLVVLIELYSGYARYTEGASAVVPKGLAISVIATGLLIFTGWKGGSLVYQHRIGVEGSGANDEPDVLREDARIRGSQSRGGPRRAA